MKNALLGALAAALIAVPLLASATQFRAGEAVRITDLPDNAQGAYNENLYLAGKDVHVGVPVEGDVWGAGETVLITGAVGGDAVLAGKNITVDANVKDDLRVIGAQVDIRNESTGGELVALGQNVAVREGAITKGVYLIGETVIFSGATAGDLVVRGENVRIDGAVAGNVLVKDAHSVTFGSHAVINGAVHYRASQEATIEEGASLLGGTTFEERTDRHTEKGRGMLPGILGLWAVLKIIGGWVLALIALALWRPQLAALQADTRGRFWWQALTGFGVFVLVPIVSVILMFTVVGILPALIALCMYAALLLAACVYTIITAASLLNEWLFRNRYAALPWFMPLLGGIALYAVCLVPFIGWLAVFLVFLAGLGTLARALGRIFRPRRPAGAL